MKRVLEHCGQVCCVQFHYIIELCMSRVHASVPELTELSHMEHTTIPSEGLDADSPATSFFLSNSDKVSPVAK
jgi:hypothetical protein